MTKVLLIIVGIAVGMKSSVAFAEHDDMPSGHEASEKVTPELKKDLADMYQKMANCLRTDKSFDQCSDEAMKNCPVVEKTGHCPINEGVGPIMGKRMKHSRAGMGMGKMNDGHDNMPAGDHAKHEKDGDADKK